MASSEIASSASNRACTQVTRSSATAVLPVAMGQTVSDTTDKSCSRQRDSAVAHRTPPTSATQREDFLCGSIIDWFRDLHCHGTTLGSGLTPRIAASLWTTRNCG